MMVHARYLVGAPLRSVCSLGACIALAACATTSPLGVEREPRPADLEALKAVGAKAPGMIVWTSSRAGLAHLFTMRTDGSDIKQLTKGDQTDWYPRFSPDGSRILFCRSRDEGFVRESTANDPGAWDIYTVNLDGSELTKVVDDGCWGTWAGPDQIVFVRGATILRTGLGGGDVQPIMDLGRHPIFDGAIVQAPELSRDGQSIAMTLAGVHRQVGLWHLDKKTWTVIGAGGQVAWAPDGSVYWVNVGGKDRAEISRLALENGQPPAGATAEVLVDVPGKRSREAFPRLSNVTENG